MVVLSTLLIIAELQHVKKNMRNNAIKRGAGGHHLHENPKTNQNTQQKMISDKKQETLKENDPCNCCILKIH